MSLALALARALARALQVFDGEKPASHRYVEGDAPNPLNAYAASKRAMELLLEGGEKEGGGQGWPVGKRVVLRSSNIIGPPAPLQPISATKFTQWLQSKLRDPDGDSDTKEFEPATLFKVGSIVGSCVVFSCCC